MTIVFSRACGASVLPAGTIRPTATEMLLDKRNHFTLVQSEFDERTERTIFR